MRRSLRSTLRLVRGLVRGLVPVAALLGATTAAHAEDAAPAPAATAEDAAPALTQDIAPADGKLALRGTLIGKRDRAPAIGATVVAVATGGGATGEEVVITDEGGRYELRVAPGVYDLIVYYVASTTSLARQIAITSDVELDVASVEDVSDPSDGCVFIIPRDPTLETQPRFGLATRRDAAPPSRDRTHRAWIAPVVGADARTAVTTVEGGARLPGAPGIPLAFIEEVQTHTMRVPITLPAGTGGAADLALRHGSNTPSGHARLVLGLDRPRAPDERASAGLEAIASGPLRKDLAWLAAGLAAQDDHRGARGAHGMLALQVMPSLTHRFAVVGLAGAAADGARDGWTSARWTATPFDHKLELQAIATAERLTAPNIAPSAGPAELAARAAVPQAVAAPAEVTDRLGGRLALAWRGRAHGYHRLELSAGGGAGERDGARHADGSLAAGDAWQLRPNLQLDAGVRWEVRTYAGERAAVLAPRASLTYDFTREGRADAFVAYQRVPLLDDAAPGRWRGLPALARDELAAGAALSPERLPRIMIGAAVRARRAVAGEAAAPATAGPSAPAELEAGVEAWLRVSGHRTHLHAAATSLDRAASVHAQRRLIDRGDDRLIAGVLARWTAAGAAAGATGAGAGASLAWQRTGMLWHRGALELALEAYAGAGGPGGRLVAGATW